MCSLRLPPSTNRWPLSKPDNHTCKEISLVTPANHTTRKREFGSGFCRLATRRRLKRHNRVEFHKDAMPLDLLISIQDGTGYGFNSIDTIGTLSMQLLLGSANFLLSFFLSKKKNGVQTRNRVGTRTF